MSCQSRRLHSKWKAIAKAQLLLLLLLSFLAIFATGAWGLSQDGILLLQFKYSVLADPLGALSDWDYDAATPCAWNGVLCMSFQVDATAAALPLDWTTNVTGGGAVQQSSTTTRSRVIGLVLPNSHLLGSIPEELGLIEHLRHLDLSGNVINGTLPASLFNASELRTLALADNEISGELPELSLSMTSLQALNLSDNALVGVVPASLSLLPNLTTVSLANNYLDGELPAGGFDRLDFLDLSSNLVNGSLPADLGGQKLRYLNLSYNRLSGEIPPELGSRILANATMDLSFNNLTGEVPEIGVFATQKATAFAGNPDLCGKPLKNLCTIPSTLSNPPNASTTALDGPESPPAIAALPNSADGTSPAGGATGQRGLKPTVVIAITVGDLAGIGILFLVFFYVYHLKRKRRKQQQQEKQQHMKNQVRRIELPKEFAPPASPESKGTIAGLSCCFGEKSGDGDDTEETSETSSSSSGAEAEENKMQRAGKEPALAAAIDGKSQSQQKQQGATLVTVDGESELELETLLKASAYIISASGSSILYKAVPADGTTLAVRRIGESSATDKRKDFDAQVRFIAKFRHPNLLRLRGYYWGPDEKLLIHDFASNGSLANISFSRKFGTSPFHLSWEARLRIARGVARGLAYLHEKKTMHGNVKPSNILIDADMDAKIADFGVDRLISGEGSYKLGTSARQFGSKRSMHSTNSLPELSPVAGASPCGSSASTAAGAAQPYQAPEALKNLKPNAKWDVYAFGMVLLELIAGRVFSEVELCQWNAGFVVEERGRILRIADPAIRGEVEGKEEAVLGCLRLGFACCTAAPHKRPPMKDAVQVLEKMPFAGSSSC